MFLANGRCPVRLRQAAGDRNNLTDDFRVLMKPVFIVAVKIPCEWMDNEQATLDSATRSKMSPVALENNIDRLLPKGLRHKVKRSLSAAVDQDNQSVYQIGVKRITVAADPEEIVQGEVGKAREISHRPAQEERNILALRQQHLKKSSVGNTPGSIFGRHRRPGAGEVAVRHGFRTGVCEVNPDSFHHGAKLQAVDGTERHDLMEVPRRAVLQFIITE